ncbi:hypothetical protein [Aureibacter tunicatorum]|uniref:Uncharacterized protein n=1 Tax=Aureibacter tunicatorum TaxID=866807 RepID=A0AAE4BUP5_9BACT|nr:hypothetical protein [Aureibacter tunicatorum]MDR6241017.1 hypothetical protein [Aureibacter tunicatorum]
MIYQLKHKENRSQIQLRGNSIGRYPLSALMSKPIQTLMSGGAFEEMIGKESLAKDHVLGEVHLLLLNYAKLGSGSDSLQKKAKQLHLIEKKLFKWYSLHRIVAKKDGRFVTSHQSIKVFNLLEDLRVEHQDLIKELMNSKGHLWVPGIEDMAQHRQEYVQRTWQMLAQGSGRLKVDDVDEVGLFKSTHDPKFKAYILSMFAKIMTIPMGRMIVRRLMEGAENYSLTISKDKTPREKQTMPRLFTHEKVLEEQRQSSVYHGGLGRQEKKFSEHELLFPEVYTDHRYLRCSKHWALSLREIKACSIPEKKVKPKSAVEDGIEMSMMTGATAMPTIIDPEVSVTDKLGRKKFIPEADESRESDWVEISDHGVGYVETLGMLELSPAFLQLFRHLVDVYRVHNGFSHPLPIKELYATDPDLKRWTSREMHEMALWENEFRMEYGLPSCKWNKFLHLGDVLKNSDFN